MFVIYHIFIFLLCLSIDACNARSFGGFHAKASSSEIKLSDQVENGLNKIEVMKLGLQKVRRKSLTVRKSSSNLVSNKLFDSVSMAVPHKTHSFDHPVFHSDYDRPKPKAPCHN